MGWKAMAAAAVWCAVWGSLVTIAAWPRCSRAADLTITNQVQYHHREVFVSLEAVPLETAIKEIYRRALAPRAVSFLHDGPRRAGDRVTIQYQGPPWVLVEMLADMLEARGYAMHTTLWGSDVIVRRDVGPRQPTPPPAVVPPIGSGLGGGGGAGQ